MLKDKPGQHDNGSVEDYRWATQEIRFICYTIIMFAIIFVFVMETGL